MPISFAEQKARSGAPWKWLALALLVALSLLTGRLGLWQLDRADEKRDMAQKRQIASSKPPIALERLNADALTNLEGQRLRLRIDAPLSNWYLDSRTYKGQAGLYVLAVLPLDGPEDGLPAPKQEPTESLKPLPNHHVGEQWRPNHVLLLRGWQAKDPRQPQGIQDRGKIQAGEYVLLRVEPEREHMASRLGLGDRIAGDNLQHWLAVDSRVMSEQSGLQLAPYVLRQLEAAQDEKGQSINDGLVRDWPEPSDGIDKHRAYALQWFLFSGLSLALAVVIAFRWRID